VVGVNQHRWKQSLSDYSRSVLEEAADRLDWAWQTDMKGPTSYPLNTNYAFGEIKGQIMEALRGRSRIIHQAIGLPPPPPPPGRLSQLVDERTIRVVYEQQHDGTYQNTLKLAASGDRKASSAWRRILRAVNAAYLIGHYGDEFIPKPRVQFLHRELLEIAEVAGLQDLSHQGIVEFLDDLCPCGKRHTAEAIRKLRKRLTAGKLSKR